MDFKNADIPGEEDVRRSAEAHLVGKARNDPAFRQELIRNPRGVIARELGVQLPSDFDVKVFEETPKSLYLVLPPAVDDSELSDELLEAVAGGCGKAPTQEPNPDPTTLGPSPSSTPMPKINLDLYKA
jgi:hypothetical protein